MLVAHILDSIDLKGGRIDVIELSIGLVGVVEVNDFGLHWIERVNYYNWRILSMHIIVILFRWVLKIYVIRRIDLIRYLRCRRERIRIYIISDGVI